jgi:hypothetical protein
MLSFSPLALGMIALALGSGSSMLFAQRQGRVPSVGAEMARALGDFASALGQPAPGGIPLDPYAGWQSYRHPQGPGFRYPADWKTRETPSGLMLLPPDFEQQWEMLLAFGTGAQGAKSAGDPRLLAQLDAMLRREAPTMRRTGQPQARQTRAGQGVAVDYSARTPNGGLVRCRVYVVVAGELALGISLLGEDSRFRKRVEMVERIFGSFDLQVGSGAGEPTAAGGGARKPSEVTDDRRLIGRFAGEAITRQPGVYVNTQLVTVLNPDGTAYYGAKSAFSMSKRDYNGDLIWSADRESSANVQKGTWTARGGYLTIRWTTGSVSRFAYGFEPDGTLALRNAQTRKLINIYKRVR